MDKEILIQKVKEGKFDNNKLITWIGSLPNDSLKAKPISYKVGDLFFHNIFKHPYVLLEKKKDNWICGLLTSNGECDEVLEICKSRFFSDSYITKALFTVSEIKGAYIGSYDNNRHLKDVLRKLKEELL